MFYFARKVPLKNTKWRILSRALKKFIGLTFAALIALTLYLWQSPPGPGFEYLYKRTYTKKARRVFSLYQEQQNQPTEFIILGDSHFQSMNGNSLGKSFLNFGISGDTIEGLTQRLPDYKNSLKETQLIFLQVGTNNLAYERSSISEIDRAFSELVTRLNSFSSAKVVWTGLFETGETKEPVYNSQAVKAANQLIVKHCKQLPDCSYLDPRIFMQGDGLYQKDGIHLSAKAYLKWAEQLRKIIPLTTI